MDTPRDATPPTGGGFAPTTPPDVAPPTPVTLRGLPSLDLLRGFVAVGRRMSITVAARDLCLTQSAVSRQVKELEDRLGMKLLVRSFRAVSFTPEGERLFRIADATMHQLQDVIGSLRATGARRPVVLTTSIGVAGLWLLPRLVRFQQTHPGIDLRIAADNRLVDLRVDDIDLAIRYAPAGAVPEDAVLLFEETMAPVASPALGVRRLTTAQELAAVTLLEYDDPSRPFLRWGDRLAALSLDLSDAASVLHFNQYDQVIQAAIDGGGVALGRLNLIRPHLAAGRLQMVESGPPGSAQQYGYWLLRGRAPVRADVRDVADWLESEARRSAIDHAARH